jgi:hypothetical protein
MPTRHASCSRGQLHLTIEGEPARVSMCHCLECQRRTGAVMSNQARFPVEQVAISGKATQWKRVAESGSVVTFNFCAVCGSTVYWQSESFGDVIVVAVGALADPQFPAPAITVWEETRHAWFALPADVPLRRRRNTIPRTEIAAAPFSRRKRSGTTRRVRRTWRRSNDMGAAARRA